MGWLIEPLETRRLLASVPAGFVDEPWGGSFLRGTAMEFAPDGRLIVTTQTGDVRVIDAAGNLLPDPALMLDVAAVGEGGLLGVALDPGFASNGYVYLHFSNPEPAVSMVARFVMTGNTIDPASRTDIFQFGATASAHQGGAIHFGADGMLYIARGDNRNGPAAQQIDNFYGKLLRINPAAYDPADPLAVIPPDNPSSFPGISGSTTGAHRAIWAVGLRNPFTFAVHPTSGRILINDVGEASFEEVNDGLAGRNYGWPATEGGFNPAQFPDFTPPLYYYGRTAGTTIAGGAFYLSAAPNAFPAQYQGKYFFGDFGGRRIGYIDADTPPTTHSTHALFATNATLIADLSVGDDGALYYLGYTASSGAGVRRVRFPPPTPPTATIQLPTRYNAGDAIHFSGTASDPNQPVFPPSAFLWTVVLHHDGLTDTIFGPTSGITSGTFHVPRRGVASVDQFYRVHLTVTDDTVLQHSTFRDVRPNTVNVTLQTFPANLPLYFDGQPHTTPLTIPSIVGYQRTLAAPSNQLHDDQWLEFFGWYDGGERVREIFVPATDTLYLAAYVADTAAPTVVSSRFDYDGVLLSGAPHRIRFAFSEDVSASLSGADLRLVNATTGQTVPETQLALAWDPIANLATFTYTGSADRILPDGNYLATLLATGVTDPPGHALQGDHVLSFRVLAGDADGDGRVNLRDFNTLAANFGRPNALFSQGNFNYDGAVDTADLAILASRFGTTLPDPAPARFTRTGTGVDDDVPDDLLA